MDRRAAPVGGSSLLAIFGVLCLTVFALLSLETVRADGRLSRKSAEAVTGYYAADCAAEELLARLRSGELPPEVTREPDGSCTYACPISAGQTLRVRVRLSPDGAYEILRWQAGTAAERTEENAPLPVWDGALPE